MVQKKINVKREDSLKKRYFYKLGTNLLGIPIGFLTLIIVPRGLGPARYGDFNFLTNFFTQLSGFFNLGTSLGFYTKLSKRPEEPSLIRFYWGFVAITSLIMILFVALIFTVKGHSGLWVDQKIQFIWMGLFWSILYQITQIVNQILDAYGLTVKSEIALLKRKIIGIFFLGLLFLLDGISLFTFFIYHFLMFILISLFWWNILKRNNIEIFPVKPLSRQRIKQYSSEFYQYSHPLFIYSLIGLICGLADRWMLQFFSGSMEQGFYSFGFKISAVIFLFSKSMTPLFTREFSIAFHKNDITKMRNLFETLLPQFYFIASFIAIFFFINSEQFAGLLGGSDFRGARSSLMIMSLYPIHQTLGQLSGSVYYASERTKTYSKIGILGMITGLVLSFIFIAPQQFGGLHLAAYGLAFKMVINQVIFVNLQLWFNTRFLNLSFVKLLIYQIFILILFAILAFLAKKLAILAIDNTILQLLYSGLLYFLVIIFIVYLFPNIIMISRTQLNGHILYIKRKLVG